MHHHAAVDAPAENQLVEWVDAQAVSCALLRLEGADNFDLQNQYACVKYFQAVSCQQGVSNLFHVPYFDGPII